MDLLSPESWLFAILTFSLGVIVKYLFNVFSSSKLEVEKYIVLDKNTKPWIRVRNLSRFIKACDLRLFISYYKNEDRVHTKIIKDGILKGGEEEMYPITPQDRNGNDISYDITNSHNHIEVILIYRNKFNTMSVKEQKVVYNIIQVSDVM